MKVIFLDVDGVLITADTCRKGYGIADNDCVAAVNALIEQTGAAIVLSSCWRIGLNNLVEICEQLDCWGIKANVLGSTPYGYSKTRGEEIQQWLDENSSIVTSFVILDDDTDMGHLLPYLVQSTFYEGFRIKHIPKAIKVLDKQKDSC